MERKDIPDQKLHGANGMSNKWWKVDMVHPSNEKKRIVIHVRFDGKWSSSPNLDKNGV